MTERDRHSDENAISTADSGFDMAPTIQFYEENIDTLIRTIPEQVGEASMDVEISGMEYIHLTQEQIQGLLSRFPESARERSVLKSITGNPSLWFRRNTPEGEPPVTTDRNESLSPTAIVPSYVAYTDNESGGFDAHIELYEIPEDAASDPVRTLIHAQGLVHEMGHTIIAPIIYGDNEQYQLRIENGDEVTVIDAEEHFRKFAQIAGKLPPISRYASAYRDEHNDFKQYPSLTTSVSEELVESIAAGILQFSNTPDPNRRLIPLVDRPEVKGIVEDLLLGEKV